MTDIDDYCSEIESNADVILSNSESYSDELLEQARDFRGAAAEIRRDSRIARDKYFELKDRYEEANEEIVNCYDALERLATNEELHEGTREHVTDEHEETREAAESSGLRRREYGAGLIVAALGVLAGGKALGFDDTGSGQSGSQVKASITKADEIGSYLEDRVMESDMLGAEANWGDLLSEYDSESGKFFPESDRTLERLDITLDSNHSSEYRVSMGINGGTEYETRPLREDKAAENALEYFGEI